MKDKIKKILEEVCLNILYVIIIFSGIIGLPGLIILKIVEFVFHLFVKLYNKILSGRKSLKDKIEKTCFVILKILSICLSAVEIWLRPFSMAIIAISLILLSRGSYKDYSTEIQMTWIAAVFAFPLLDILDMMF